MRRLYEVVIFGLCFLVDPTWIIAIGVIELTHWYLTQSGRIGVRSNGF